MIETIDEHIEALSLRLKMSAACLDPHPELVWFICEALEQRLDISR
jgi:hypothetical protein